MNSFNENITVLKSIASDNKLWEVSDGICSNMWLKIFKINEYLKAYSWEAFEKGSSYLHNFLKGQGDVLNETH